LSIEISTGKTVFWPYTEARRRIRRKDHGLRLRLERVVNNVREVVVIEDSAALSQIQLQHPGFGDATLSSRLFTPLLFVAALVVAIPPLYWFALPPVVEKLSEYAPVEMEEQLGDRMADAMVPPSAACADVDVRTAVDGVITRLTIAAQEPRYKWRFTIADDAQINVAAFPGGRLVVTRGLLARTASLEELAGALAPEIYQLSSGHTRRIVFTKLAFPGLIALTVGNGKKELAQLAAQSGQIYYSEQEVNEGLLKGLSLVQQARIDPHGMVEWFSKLESDPTMVEGAHAYSGAHPGLRGAAQRLRAAISKQPSPKDAFQGAANWDNVRFACGAGTTKQ